MRNPLFFFKIKTDNVSDCILSHSLIRKVGYGFSVAWLQLSVHTTFSIFWINDCKNDMLGRTLWKYKCSRTPDILFISIIAYYMDFYMFSETYIWKKYICGFYHSSHVFTVPLKDRPLTPQQLSIKRCLVKIELGRYDCNCAEEHTYLPDALRHISNIKQRADVDFLVHFSYVLIR